MYKKIFCQRQVFFLLTKLLVPCRIKIILKLWVSPFFSLPPFGYLCHFSTFYALKFPPNLEHFENTNYYEDTNISTRFAFMSALIWKPRYVKFGSSLPKNLVLWLCVLDRSLCEVLSLLSKISLLKLKHDRILGLLFFRICHLKATLKLVRNVVTKKSNLSKSQFQMTLFWKICQWYCIPYFSIIEIIFLTYNPISFPYSSWKTVNYEGFCEGYELMEQKSERHMLLKISSYV